ncbi:MAG TPA: TetR/AcrR family transcriptional regulator [Nocardioides sp.]|nr:TetR/AcrR family transcriptional regulator [Nocardioides sp.]
MSTEIPRAIRALWRPVDEPRRRGPKPALSIDAIAAAGVAIADADGLDSVSMAAVAKRLGFSAMALYRYVDAKETLLALMVDAAYGPPPRIRARTWRPALTTWASAMLDGLRAHPWAAHVRTGPPLTPNAIAWMDLGLGILTGAGIDDQPAASALLVVDGYVRNHVTMEQMYADASAVAWAPALRSLLGPDQFLAVQAGLDAGVFDDDPGDEVFPADQFGFGLGLVLDGIERLTGG